MEVSCTAVSLGAQNEPVVPTNSDERETSLKDKSDIDPSILTETEAVLRKIVNTIEKYAKKNEPVAAPAQPFIKLNVGINNLQTESLKEQGTANGTCSSKVEQSVTAVNKTIVKLLESNSKAVGSDGEKKDIDECTVINNETKECTVLPFEPLNANEGASKIYEQNNIEVSNKPRKLTPKQLVDSQIDACYKANNSVSFTKVGDASVKVIKQISVPSQKPSRKDVRRSRKPQPSSVIDQLFNAARKGDKNDFKRILYVNYDNIVNDYIDNTTQSDSCASTSEETAHVKDTFEICDNPSSDLVTDTEPLDGSSTSADEEGISDLDSKLVICEKQEEAGSGSSGLRLDNNEVNKVEGAKQTKKRVPNFKEISRKVAAKKLKTGAESVNGLRVPDFKEISRKVAAKKLKTGAESVNGLRHSDNSAENSGPLNVDIKIDQNENYTSDFVDVVNIKQEPDTEDYFASSELDESISQSELSADESSIKIKIEDLAKNPSVTDCSPVYEPDLQFICQHCDRKYRNLVHLRNHQAQNHFNETRFTCEACSTVFPSLDKLKDHEKVHVIIDKNYCELCKKSYSSKPAIRRHAETVHVVEKQRPHQCDICDFAFTCRWHLREHLRIHTGKKDHPCPVCKRGFNHVGSMNRHAKDQHNFDTSTGKYFEGNVTKTKKGQTVSLVKFAFKKIKVITPQGEFEEVIGVQKDIHSPDNSTTQEPEPEVTTIKLEPVDPDYP